MVRIWPFGPYNCTKQGVWAIMPVYILLRLLWSISIKTFLRFFFSKTIFAKYITMIDFLDRKNCLDSSSWSWENITAFSSGFPDKSCQGKFYQQKPWIWALYSYSFLYNFKALHIMACCYYCCWSRKQRPKSVSGSFSS